MGSRARFSPGDMVELVGPHGGATGEVIAVDGDVVNIHVTGDLRPADVGSLDAASPAAPLDLPTSG